MRSLRGQPKGLYPLFFTEMWERFGFYTVQAILILYITNGLRYPDAQAYLLYAAFSALIYLTPVVGGYLADHWLGFRKAVNIGGVLFILGYALMAIPGKTALFWGMSLVVVANGFFKPNVSSMVGDLYQGDDPRRDGGYTIFYMGINIGSIFPPIFSGPLVNRYGWNSGFLCASVGITLGLLTFLSYRKKLASLGTVPLKSPLHVPRRRFFYLSVLWLGIAGAVVTIHWLFSMPQQTDTVLIFSTIAIIGAIVRFLFKETHQQRRKLWAVLILLAISAGFWAIYNQTYTSVMLFADRNMVKEIFDFEIDPEFMQFYNPLFILIFAPILSWLWSWLGARNQNPSTAAKFSTGVLLLACSYLVLGLGARLFASPEGEASPWWVVLNSLFLTLGELLLGPIGLAMITRFVPRPLVGMMMGVWFLTLSLGFAIGGRLGALAAVPPEATRLQSLEVYSNAFLTYGALGVGLAILGYLITPAIKKLTKEAHSYTETT